MSTVQGGQRYGMGEVVADALIQWIFEGGHGDLCLAASGYGKSQRRCVIHLKRLRLRGNIARITITKN
ncbi:MAG: hypothetical protein Q7S15_00255 [bacterium]|nr:hypothetical protein [bacterium]